MMRTYAENATIRANRRGAGTPSTALTDRPSVSRRRLMRVYSHTPLIVRKSTHLTTPAALGERPAASSCLVGRCAA